jgi:hypothetical protein
MRCDAMRRGAARRGAARRGAVRCGAAHRSVGWTLVARTKGASSSRDDQSPRKHSSLPSFTTHLSLRWNRSSAAGLLAERTRIHSTNLMAVA